MTVAAQRAHIAYAIQKTKVAAATFVPTAGGTHIITAGFQRHKMAGADIGVQEIRDALAPTLGGGLFVDGTYKGAVTVAGSVQMEPRLQNSLGHLLYAAAGSYAVTASAGAVSYIHRFYVDQANQNTLPWMTVRRYTPDTAGNGGNTEYFVDSKIAAATMRVPQMGVMSMEFQFAGRRPINNVATETTTGNAYETSAGVALSCNTTAVLGFDAIGALAATSQSAPTNLGFVGAEMTVINGLTGPREEVVMGSRYMDDLQPLTRAAMIRLIYNWKDPVLYNRMLYAVTTGTDIEWSPEVQTGSLILTSTSAANIGAPYTHPYKLVFQAPVLNWSIAAPRLMPGRILQTEMSAIVVETNSASVFPWFFDLYNTSQYNFTS